jgi:hypothetical protein
MLGSRDAIRTIVGAAEFWSTVEPELFEIAASAMWARAQP